MRLFFAIELPTEVQATLGRLKPPEDNRDYRWSDPSLLHVTLVFLGEQPESRLSDVEEAGSRAAGVSTPGTLRLGEAGSFGGHRKPRVLWVGLGGDVERLTALQTRLAGELTKRGFELEDRPFRPHITLARRRETATGPAPLGWPPTRQLEKAAIDMRQLTLFQSRLSPRGPTYIPLAQFALSSS